MEVKSLNPEDLTDILQNKIQESASSFESYDTDSCQIEAKISQLQLDDYPEHVTNKRKEIMKNSKNLQHKFIDLISQEESNVEKLETTQTDNTYNPDSRSLSKSPIDDITYNQEDLDELRDVIKNEVYESSTLKAATNTLIKRTHLKSLIYEMYDLGEAAALEEENRGNGGKQVEIIIQGIMEKLPLGKTLKNSVLLAWKQRYFQLNSIGLLSIFDGADQLTNPLEVYNLMGAKVTYEQNRVVSLDDCRGNCIVFRCYNDPTSSLFHAWKSAIDSQIIDRSETLWVRPNRPLTLNKPSVKSILESKKKVLIVDIGTCSIRAGLFSDEPKLPKLFVPTVCARDFNQMDNKIRVGFDAFDSVLASTAPSTIDLNRAASTWSLNSTGSVSSSSGHLQFPLRNKKAIDKLSMDITSIDAILEYIVESLDIICHDHQIIIVTPQKFSDKLNVQFLNLLLVDEKYQFEAATLMNQTLMSLYAYNSTVGVVANLGEKIDIVPICNGVSFQAGISNLAYGGGRMSEYLNGYVSRGHANYVNDMEQFYVRYIKEKVCYAAVNYKDECKKNSNESAKFKLELNDHVNETKSVEIPQSARFTTVEGLFNPEIWGIDGVGIHKLIHKAITSCSIDLRREMARNIYLSGGMSRIPGLRERLENEIKQLLPPTLTVKVNCSEFSYHSAYLGAHKFLTQPESKGLMITREEWSNENVDSLKRWRMI